MTAAIPVSDPAAVAAAPPAPTAPAIDTPESAYARYQVEATPDNLYKTVQTLRPAISYALAQNNAAEDPFLKAKAEIVAAEAVKTWSPASGASLASWTSTQMQRLARMRRENLMPVKVPDRAWQDSMSLARAEREFIDKHNREPDLDELSDAARMPISRIATVRRQARKMVSASAFHGEQTPTPKDDPLADEAMQYLYADLDKLDRQILEMRTGFGGKHDPMPGNVIAARLKIDPSQVTRRAARMATKLVEIRNTLAEVYGDPNEPPP